MWMAAKKTWKELDVPPDRGLQDLMRRKFDEWGCKGNPAHVPGARWAPPPPPGRAEAPGLLRVWV